MNFGPSNHQLFFLFSYVVNSWLKWNIFIDLPANKCRYVFNKLVWENHSKQWQLLHICMYIYIFHTHIYIYFTHTHIYIIIYTYTYYTHINKSIYIYMHLIIYQFLMTNHDKSTRNQQLIHHQADPAGHPRAPQGTPGHPRAGVGDAWGMLGRIWDRSKPMILFFNRIMEDQHFESLGISSRHGPFSIPALKYQRIY
jgi:hypothetical protein